MIFGDLWRSLVLSRTRYLKTPSQALTIFLSLRSNPYNRDSSVKSSGTARCIWYVWLASTKCLLPGLVTPWMSNAPCTLYIPVKVLSGPLTIGTLYPKWFNKASKNELEQICFPPWRDIKSRLIFAKKRFVSSLYFRRGSERKGMFF